MRVGARLSIGPAGITLAGSAFSLIALGLANVLIGRLLGPAGVGRVASATLIPMIVGYGGELGLPAATSFLINRYRAEKTVTVAAARAVAIPLTAFLMLLSSALILMLPIDPRARGAGLLFVLFIPLNLYYRINLAVLQADMRMALFNGIRVVGSLCYLAIVLTAYLAGIRSVPLVVVALLAGNAVWFGLSSFVTFSRPFVLPDYSRSSALLGYGLRAHLGNVSAVDSLRLDQLVLAVFLAPSDLGLYVAAMTFITGNRLIGTSVGTVCFPLATRSVWIKAESVSVHLRQLVFLTVALSCAVATMEVVIGKELLGRIFGSEFVAGAPILTILAVGSIFMNLRQVAAEWIRGVGRPGIVAISELISLVSLSLLAITLWDGTAGPVAWSVSVSSVISFVTLLGLWAMTTGPVGVTPYPSLVQSPGGISTDFTPVSGDAPASQRS